MVLWGISSVGRASDLLKVLVFFRKKENSMTFMGCSCSKQHIGSFRRSGVRIPYPPQLMVHSSSGPG